MRFTTATASIVVALSGLLFTPTFAAAQDQQQSHQRGRGSVALRTYEVGDLVIDVPDYRLPVESGALASAQGGRGGGGFGGGGAYGGMMGGRGAIESGAPGAPMGMAGAIGDPQQVTIDHLRSAIINLVSPETWAQAQSGGEGRIEVIGTALVVSQTPEGHEAISDLLEQLRQGSATRRTVSIDARWLLLDSDDLDRLVGKGENGNSRVDVNALDEFTRRPSSLRGATHCFSGQAVYLISGTRRNVVSSYIPVVGSIDPPQVDTMLAAHSEQMPAPITTFAQFGGGRGADGGEMGMAMGGGRVGYQPIIEKPNFGVTLEIRPTLSTVGKDVVIDLKSTVTFPTQEMQPADAMGMPGMSSMPQVDRLSIQTQELVTTLRVPLGQPVLVGGMTYLVPIADEAKQVSQQAQAGPSEQRQLYLVIELR
jgi:hypothetical protein